MHHPWRDCDMAFISAIRVDTSWRSSYGFEFYMARTGAGTRARCWSPLLLPTLLPYGAQLASSILTHSGDSATRVWRQTNIRNIQSIQNMQNKKVYKLWHMIFPFGCTFIYIWCIYIYISFIFCIRFRFFVSLYIYIQKREFRNSEPGIRIQNPVFEIHKPESGEATASPRVLRHAVP